MSAPLTGKETCYLYELMAAIDDTAAYITNGFSVMLAITDMSIKPQIDAKIATFTDDQIDCVREIINEYLALRFDVSEIAGGTAGNQTGLNTSSAAAVANLRMKILSYIPVMTYWQNQQRRNDAPQNSMQGASSAGIAFRRG